jgi:AraC-like DNA-binding protein
MEMSSTRRANEPQSGHGPGLLTKDLRRVLRTELLRNTCSAVGVARLFSMHRRTLHRHLSAEGLGFRQVASEVRFEIACKLLSHTDMTLGQIAAALSYSELSAFTRAFRRWSGQTPSAWRSSHSRIRNARRHRKPRPHPGPEASGCRAGPSSQLSLSSSQKRKGAERYQARWSGLDPIT